MPLSSFGMTLNGWLRASPSLSGVPETDVQSFVCHVRAGEVLLARLAPKSKRSQEEALHAKGIHDACRALRRNFMGLHADWLYSILTNGGTKRKSSANWFLTRPNIVRGWYLRRCRLPRNARAYRLIRKGTRSIKVYFSMPCSAHKKSGFILLSQRYGQRLVPWS